MFKIEEPMPPEAADDVKAIIKSYLQSYDHSDDQETWFGKIRQIASDLGYAAKPKDFKKHPEEYKGHVGHVSTVIRIALIGRSQSPDVWEIQQILGETKTKKAPKSFCKNMQRGRLMPALLSFIPLLLSSEQPKLCC